MNFRITGLASTPFEHLYGLPDNALATFGVERHVADQKPGYPDRIALRDAEPGESLLLLNYMHQPAANPYQASHAIFVIEGARVTYDRLNAVPEALRIRMLSLRAFDKNNRMVDGDLVDGQDVEKQIAVFFANAEVACIHVHYAKRGCYAARIDRG